MKIKGSFLSKQKLETFKVKDLGKVVTGKTPPTKNKEYFGHKIPFLTPSDISDSKFVHKTKRYLSEKGEDPNLRIKDLDMNNKSELFSFEVS